MNKINWKILNISFWILVILSYILPFKVIDNFQYQVGVPMPFITFKATAIDVSPLMSISLNPVGLLLDVVIIYLIVLFCIKAYQKLMDKRAK